MTTRKESPTNIHGLSDEDMEAIDKASTEAARATGANEEDVRSAVITVLSTYLDQEDLA